MSHEIYKRLIALELDREYDNILLYSAIRNEVNTDEYFAYLINKAKRIYYPRVSGNTMSFYRVRSLDELNCGSFNIKEPDMNGVGSKPFTYNDSLVSHAPHFS
jgi:5-formyltetrahydrofolate cyclo-ligase